MNKKILVAAAVVLSGAALSSCASSPSNQLSFNETNRVREQGACAELGLDPAGQAFGQCVADLDASLFYAFTGLDR